MAIHWPVPLLATLFLIGMTKGIILPAMTSHLILLSGGTRFGRIFSILAIASSIGSFLGPMIAGQIRDTISPYFIAFVVLMIAVTLLPAKQAFCRLLFSPPRARQRGSNAAYCSISPFGRIWVDAHAPGQAPT